MSEIIEGFSGWLLITLAFICIIRFMVIDTSWLGAVKITAACQCVALAVFAGIGLIAMSAGGNPP